MAIHLRELGVDFERQYAYVPGRRFRADFLTVQSILIEVQGGVFNRKAHGSITGVLNDNERLNLATLHGYRLLRFTPDQVNSGEAKAFIAEVLGF